MVIEMVVNLIAYFANNNEIYRRKLNNISVL